MVSCYKNNELWKINNKPSLHPYLPQTEISIASRNFYLLFPSKRLAEEVVEVSFFHRFFFNFNFHTVCCWWRIQSRIERVFDSWISRRWLQRCWGTGYSHPNWDHHPGHQDTECFGREGTAHSWTNICCTEEVWLPRGNCWGNINYSRCLELIIQIRLDIFEHNI